MCRTHWSFFLLWPTQKGKRHYEEIVVFLTREGRGLSAGGRMGGQLTGAGENGDGEPAAAERGEGIHHKWGSARS